MNTCIPASAQDEPDIVWKFDASTGAISGANSLPPPTTGCMTKTSKGEVHFAACNPTDPNQAWVVTH